MRRFFCSWASLLAIISFLVFQTVSAQPAGEPNNLEPILQDRTSLFFYGGFEDKTICSPEWLSQWGIFFTNRCDQIEVLTGSQAFIGAKTIRVNYPQGGECYSKEGPAQYRPNLFIRYRPSVPVALAGRLPKHDQEKGANIAIALRQGETARAWDIQGRNITIKAGRHLRPGISVVSQNGRYHILPARL